MDTLQGTPVRARDGPLYVALFVGWWLLSLASLFALVYDAWYRVGNDFAADVERQMVALSDRLRANEAVLDGFAAFLGAVDTPTYEQQVRFAARVLAAHPQIYMIEVVERVPQAVRAEFEARLSRHTGGNGRISRFDYVAGRSWGPVPQKDVYYPIAFVWPETAASRPVLGLDIDAVPHLRDVLRTAAAGGVAVSSVPFALVEGALAYVMLKAAQAPDDGAAANVPQYFALLVIEADSLRPEWPAAHTAQALRVLAPGRLASPTLYEAPASDPAGALERALLPQLDVARIDFSTSQPVALSMQRQMRFADLSGGAFAMVAALSAGSLAVLVHYVRRHRRNAQQVYQDYLRASHGALHDALTGLPNRRLLLDRIQQAIAHWRRTGHGFAVIFIDLDRFKAVNDTFGHDAGDEVLRAVAARLQQGVRATDTAARISGDEFVVVLAGGPGPGELDAVVDKLVGAVAEPIPLAGGAAANVSASVGASRCPDDGETADALINRADCAMYRFKRRE